MRLETDHVFFKMPTEREYQFSAMSILQAFVNGFDEKMKRNDTSPQHDAVFNLKYNSDMNEVDWQFFKAIGLKLSYDRESLDKVEMLIDFTYTRVANYIAGRHLCEVYGALVGVESRPLPDIRRVKPLGTKPFKWAIPSNDLDLVTSLNSSERQFTSAADFINVQDNELTGFISFACWQTYWASAMGLPVIEIVPVHRPVTLLSKFTNKGYRVIVETEPNEMKRLITYAVKNIEYLCSTISMSQPRDTVATG